MSIQSQNPAAPQQRTEEMKAAVAPPAEDPAIQPTQGPETPPATNGQTVAPTRTVAAPQTNGETAAPTAPGAPPASTNAPQAEARSVEAAPVPPPSAPPANEVKPEPPASPAKPQAPALAQWEYLPLPNDPDPHTEDHEKSRSTSDGHTIIGARVRGKKHKHEGTNCDDWFEFAPAGPWTIFAVSDGAGSAKFSRIGAKASCEAAIKHLTAKLKEHHLKPREAWTADTFKRDEKTAQFIEPDVAAVGEALFEAVQEAYAAVEREFEQRKDDPRYPPCLKDGRALHVKDLSSTLLLAAHTKTRTTAGEQSFVLACQIGDGMTAMVDAAGQLKLLGEVDSGEYAGETDFITTPAKRARASLSSKFYGTCRPMRALMLMTDGVADDYYPNDPHLLRVYADLVLNGVVRLSPFTDAELASSLEGAKLKGADALRAVDCLREAERVTQTQTQRLALPDAAALAAELELAPEALAAKPALLSCVAQARADETSPAARLNIWLDSYHVRASFDDRTLVVMYPSGNAP